MALPTETGVSRLKRIARFLVEDDKGTTKKPMTMQMQLRRSLTAIGLPVASSRKSSSAGVLSVAGSAMKSWSTQGSNLTPVAETECYITQRSNTQQKHLAMISKSSSGVARLLSDACGTPERRGQPHSTHGGEVLVVAGSTAKRHLGGKRRALKPTPRTFSRRRLRDWRWTVSRTLALQARSKEGHL